MGRVPNPQREISGSDTTPSFGMLTLGGCMGVTNCELSQRP